ncbi:MAG: YceD family protein [Acidimicrobiales bacterium]
MTGRRRPFVVTVADLLARPGVQRRVEVEGARPDLALSSSAVVQGEPVRAELVLESTGSAIVASGRVVAQWIGECRRCLGEVRGEAVSEIREVFERHPTDGETYLLHGDDIDLEPLLRDAVLLALPIAPLCDQACGGPEPEAYRVMTAADEEAETRPVDPRWSVLDQLRGN